MVSANAIIRLISSTYCEWEQTAINRGNRRQFLLTDCTLILQGDLSGAIKLTHKLYPQSYHQIVSSLSAGISNEVSHLLVWQLSAFLEEPCGLCLFLGKSFCLNKFTQQMSMSYGCKASGDDSQWHSTQLKDSFHLVTEHKSVCLSPSQKGK